MAAATCAVSTALPAGAAVFGAAAGAAVVGAAATTGAAVGASAFGGALATGAEAGAGGAQPASNSRPEAPSAPVINRRRVRRDTRTRVPDVRVARATVILLCMHDADTTAGLHRPDGSDDGRPIMRHTWQTRCDADHSLLRSLGRHCDPGGPAGAIATRPAVGPAGARSGRGRRLHRVGDGLLERHCPAFSIGAGVRRFAERASRRVERL